MTNRYMNPFVRPLLWGPLTREADKKSLTSDETHARAYYDDTVKSIKVHTLNTTINKPNGEPFIRCPRMIEDRPAVLQLNDIDKTIYPQSLVFLMDERDYILRDSIPYPVSHHIGT